MAAPTPASMPIYNIFDSKVNEITIKALKIVSFQIRNPEAGNIRMRKKKISIQGLKMISTPTTSCYKEKIYVQECN